MATVLKTLRFLHSFSDAALVYIILLIFRRTVAHSIFYVYIPSTLRLPYHYNIEHAV